ncbi:uncharacterized protein G2W53_022131 [Senna tora]|uniref:Uncharacterized protein n=1 Tax=Senna tora TaxID=362788 RepID=A0A834WIG4_9FABA|nr:uncharacterized protein G2W53_022131 [Senna tora]
MDGEAVGMSMTGVGVAASISGEAGVVCKSTSSLESHSTIRFITPASLATHTPFSTAKASINATSLSLGVELVKALTTHPSQSRRTPPIAPSPFLFTPASTFNFINGGFDFSHQRFCGISTTLVA